MRSNMNAAWPETLPPDRVQAGKWLESYQPCTRIDADRFHCAVLAVVCDNTVDCHNCFALLNALKEKLS